MKTRTEKHFIECVLDTMEFPQKLRIKLSHDSAIPLLGIYPIFFKTPRCKDICTTRIFIFICRLSSIDPTVHTDTKYLALLLPVT